MWMCWRDSPIISKNKNCCWGCSLVLEIRTMPLEHLFAFKRLFLSWDSRKFSEFFLLLSVSHAFFPAKSENILLSRRQSGLSFPKPSLASIYGLIRHAAANEHCRCLTIKLFRRIATTQRYAFCQTQSIIIIIVINLQSKN